MFKCTHQVVTPYYVCYVTVIGQVRANAFKHVHLWSRTSSVDHRIVVRPFNSGNIIKSRGKKSSSPLAEIGRPLYVKVDLDGLTNNVNILRKQCSKLTGVIGVVKAGAYGHGSVVLSKHLKSIGVERLAVATIDEGLHLRRHGVPGPIHIFGNVLDWEMTSCVHYDLTPTVCTIEAVDKVHAALQELDAKKMKMNSMTILPKGSVNIKIDTGMSRNGCQTVALEGIVKKCDELEVPIDAMLTHFSDSWENEEFTRMQYKAFTDATAPYRSRDIKFHVANSGATLNKVGTDLDFIRPGISLYGLPPGGKSQKFEDFGFKPLPSIHGIPTLTKQLNKGRKVGYSCSHTTEEGEWVATLPDGYADGYWRHLSSKGTVIREKTGAKCPVIGHVSMDAITVRVPEDTEENETFTLMTADFDPDTSAVGIAEQVGSISYEVATRLSIRYPRVYTQDDHYLVIKALQSESY